MRFLDLIAAKARDFFSETSHQTFVTEDLLVPNVFGGTNMSFRVQNKVI